MAQYWKLAFMLCNTCIMILMCLMRRPNSSDLSPSFCLFANSCSSAVTCTLNSHDTSAKPPGRGVWVISNSFQLLINLFSCNFQSTSASRCVFFAAMKAETLALKSATVDFVASFFILEANGHAFVSLSGCES